MFHVPDFIDGPLRHPAYYLIRVYVKRGTHPEPTGTCRNHPEPNRNHPEPSRNRPEHSRNYPEPQGTFPEPPGTLTEN